MLRAFILLPKLDVVKCSAQASGLLLPAQVLPALSAHIDVALELGTKAAVDSKTASSETAIVSCL